MAHITPRYRGSLNKAVVLRKNPLELGDAYALVRTSGSVVQVRTSLFVGEWGVIYPSRGKQLYPFVQGAKSKNFSVNHWVFLAKKVRFFLQEKIKELPIILRAWSKSLIIGDRKNLDQSLLLSFKELGVFHLIVISGMHLSLFARLFYHFLYLPLSFCFYTSGFLNPFLLLLINIFFRLFTCFSLALFTSAIGLSCAAQRACLSFLLYQLAQVLLGPFVIKNHLFTLVVIQALFFPIGFVSLGNMMSWIAYLCILSIRGKTGNYLINIIEVQIILLLVSGVLFGTISCIALLSNLILTPVFSTVWIFCLYMVLTYSFSPLFLQEFFFSFQLSYIELAIFFAHFFQDFPFFFYKWDVLSNSVKLTLVLLIFILIFRKIKIIVIRPKKRRE